MVSEHHSKVYQTTSVSLSADTAHIERKQNILNKRMLGFAYIYYNAVDMLSIHLYILPSRGIFPYEIK